MVENASSSEVAFTNVTAADVPDQLYDDVEFKGDSEYSYGAGMLRAEVTVEYEIDTTATTGNQVVLAAILADNTNPRMLRVRPMGATAGLPEYSMDAILVSFGPTGMSREGNVMGKAVFKNHKEASTTPGWGSVSA
jgi:hypothetical protein